MAELSSSLKSLLQPSQERTEEEEREHEEELKRIIEESKKGFLKRNIQAGVKQAFGSAKSLASTFAAQSVKTPTTLGGAIQRAQAPKPEDNELFALQLKLSEEAKAQSKAEFDKVNEQAKLSRDADELAGDNETIGKAVRGAFSSLTQFGIMSPTGPIGVIGSFAALAANDGYHEAIDAGLSEKESEKHAFKKAAIEGVITSVFQGAGKLLGNGMGGLESLSGAKAVFKEGMSAGLQKAGIGLASELTEENLIELSQAYVSMMDDVDPDAFNPDNLLERVKDTTLTTALTFGLASGGRAVIDRGSQALSTSLSKTEETEKRVAALSENPSRKEFAEALGVPLKELPEFATTKSGREAIRQESIKNVNERTQQEDTEDDSKRIEEEAITEEPAQGVESQLIEEAIPVDVPVDVGEVLGGEGGQQAVAQATEAQVSPVERKDGTVDVKPGQTFTEFPTSKLALKPDVMQFKLERDKKGATGALPQVKSKKDFKKSLFGFVTAWIDPDTGEVIVTDGHNRIAKAQDIGIEAVGVIISEAKTVEDARAEAALMNIANDKGTAVDAAQFFRDTGMTVEDLRNKGIKLTESKAGQAVDIANLTDALFSMVARKEMTPVVGAIIGKHIAEPQIQLNAAEAILKRKDPNKDTVEQIVLQFKNADKVTTTEMGLFGEEILVNDILAARGDIIGPLVSDLKQRSAALKGAIRKRKVLEASGSTIDVDQSRADSEEAGAVVAIFDALKDTGVISDKINEAAAQLTENPKLKPKELADAISEEIFETVRQEGIDRGIIKRTAKAPGGDAKAQKTVTGSEELDAGRTQEEGDQQDLDPSVEESPDVQFEHQIHRESLEGIEAEKVRVLSGLQEAMVIANQDTVNATMPDGTPYVEELGEEWSELTEEQRKAQIETDFQQEADTIEQASQERIETINSEDAPLLDKARKKAQAQIEQKQPEMVARAEVVKQLADPELTQEIESEAKAFLDDDVVFTTASGGRNDAEGTITGEIGGAWQITPLGSNSSISIPKENINKVVRKGKSHDRADKNKETTDQQSLFGVPESGNPLAMEQHRTALDAIQDEQFEPVAPPIERADHTEVDPSKQGGFFIGPKPKKKPKKPSSEFRPDRVEVSENMDNAEIKPNEKRIAELKRTGREILSSITRVNLDLPNTEEFAVANEVTRLFKDSTKRAVRDTEERLDAILNPLRENKKDFDLFKNYILALDMHESVTLGEPLRYGFKSLSEIKRWLDKLQAFVNKNKKVQKAYANRKILLTEIQDALKEHGIIPDTVDRQEYFRHEVREYMIADGVQKGHSAIKKINESFAKSRVKSKKLGEAGEGITELDVRFDPNTDYIGAERAFLIRANEAIETAKTLDALQRRYDRMPEFRDRASDINESLQEGEDVVTAQSLVRRDEDLVLWQPDPGTIWYPALTITEQQMEQMDLAIMEGNPFELPDVKEVLAMGGPKQQWAIPKELRDHLNRATVAKDGGHLREFHAQVLSSWKRWILHNPLTVIPYNIRNSLGDLGAMLAGNPSALKKVPQALREIVEVETGTKRPSPEYLEAQQFSVMDATEQHADIYRAAQQGNLKEFYPRANKWLDILNPADTLDKLLKPFVDVTQARESVFRYAAYLDYKQKMKSGKKFNHGASRPRDVAEIRKSLGVEAAAAHMARNLLGDYGNITVAGEGLRKHFVPFWAFSEINARRYYRIAIENLTTNRSDNRAINAGLATLAFARIGTLYGLMTLWNHTRFPDEEENLAEFDKSTPHLILGSLDDGTVIILRNTSALGELFEWFGINDLISQSLSNFKGVRAGQETLGDLAANTSTNILNKFVGSLSPTTKGSVEALTGYSAFPDILNLRQQPRGEIIAGQVGLTDAYKQIRGAVTKDGLSTRPHMLLRHLAGATNSRSNALNEQYNLIQKFERSKGIAPGNRTGLSEHRNMKQALKNGNKKAFGDALKNYLADTGDFTKFASVMDRIDPFHGNLDKELEPEYVNDFITPEQRVRYLEAKSYAAELKTRGWVWFEQATEEMGPEAVKKFEFEKAKEIVSIVAPLGRPRPVKTSKREILKVEQDRAMQELSGLGLTREDILDAVRTFNSQNPSSKDKSSQFFRNVSRKTKSLQDN